MFLEALTDEAFGFTVRVHVGRVESVDPGIVD